MSKFTDFEAFYPTSYSNTRYELGGPLSWEIGCRGSGWLLAIPAGTRFDISVPRWLTWALSPHDRRVLPAAAIHDALLEAGHDAAFASAEFRRACIARGVNIPFAWALFAATFVWTVVLSPQAAAATS